MLSEKLLIVPMANEHIGALTALERVCFAAPWSAAALSAELSNEQAHFLVAVCGGKVAGYIGAHEICGEGYITNVAVYPEYRRRGIASRLIKSAAEGAAGRGCAFLSLEVRAGNLSAVSLYGKHGFCPAGLRKSFYADPEEDALIMTLRFKPENTNP